MSEADPYLEADVERIVRALAKPPGVLTRARSLWTWRTGFRRPDGAAAAGEAQRDLTRLTPLPFLGARIGV